MEIYITVINKKKRGHEFEKEQGKVSGRVWKEERKGNDIINQYNYIGQISPNCDM